MTTHARGLAAPPGGVWQVAKFQLRNVVRSKWLLCYFVFFVVATEGLLRFTGSDARTILSLGNIVLTIVPLITLVYGIIYLYHNREFVELLLAQPIRRQTIFAGLYVGLCLPLALAVVAGVSLPLALHQLLVVQGPPLATLLAGSAALTAIFTGIAFTLALRFEDRLTGLGAGLGIWLLMTVIYDGALLFVVAMFPDTSFEKLVLAATLANPLDLVRIALLLQFDIAALLGYTGAVFTDFFSGLSGMLFILLAVTLWIGLPAAGGLMAFRRKDF